MLYVLRCFSHRTKKSQYSYIYAINVPLNDSAKLQKLDVGVAHLCCFDIALRTDRPPILYVYNMQQRARVPAHLSHRQRPQKEIQ